MAVRAIHSILAASTLTLAHLSASVTLAQPSKAVASPGAKAQSPKLPSTPAPQPSADTSQDMKQGARMLYDLAKKVASARNIDDHDRWTRIEILLDLAWSRSPSHDIAANLGRARDELGRKREAAELFDYAIRVWPLEDTRSPKYALYLKRFNELKQELGKITIRVTEAAADAPVKAPNSAGGSGRAELRDAAISVNSKPVGRSPLEHDFFVDPGKEVTIVVSLPGFETSEERLTVKSGESKDVLVSLKQAATRPTAAASSPIPADASSEPASGTRVASTTPTLPSSPNVTPSSPGIPRAEILAATAALAGATVVSGVILFGVALDQQAQLRVDAPKDDQGMGVCASSQPSSGASPICDDLRSRAQTTKAIGQSGIGLMIAGGVIQLATVTLALVWRTPRGEKQSSLSPMVSTSGAGLRWSGSF